MTKALNEESSEFLATLCAMASDSNSDEEFCDRLMELGMIKSGGLRGHVGAQCAAIDKHIEGLLLDRKMIVRLIGA
mgnify:CR=1 FL=1